MLLIKALAIVGAITCGLGVGFLVGVIARLVFDDVR